MDWETYDKYPRRSTKKVDSINHRIVGVAIAYLKAKRIKSFYIPMNHLTDEKQLTVGYVLKKLKPILESKKYVKVAHNAKFELAICNNYRIRAINFACTQVMVSHYNNYYIQKRCGLKYLVLHFFKYKMKEIKEVIGDKDFRYVSLKKALSYAGDDAYFCLKLYHWLSSKFAGDRKTTQYIRHTEFPIIYICNNMERRGAFIDPHMVKKVHGEFLQLISKYEIELYTLYGEPFNYQKPRLIIDYLYNRKKYKKKFITDKGNVSVNENTLKHFAKTKGCRFSELILELRSLKKFINTYIRPLNRNLDYSSRIHCNWNQTQTRTYRFSSSEPNLQNIPSRSSVGRHLRDCFAAPYGKKLIRADFSQIELRVCAHMSEDENMINVFLSGGDIHKETEDACKVDRITAKVINFRNIYGGSAWALARELSVPKNQAQDFIDDWFANYPQIKPWQQSVINYALRYKHIKTISKNRVCISQSGRVNHMINQALNTPIQSSAAIIFKKSLIDLVNDSKFRKFKNTYPVIQVHDEIVVETDEDIAEEVKDRMKFIMENCYKLRVPIEVDIDIGDRWGELK
jgi:DNA polymerase-1